MPKSTTFPAEPTHTSLAKKKATGYMGEKGSDDHYLWWQHFYKRKIHETWLDERLKAETLDDFSRRLYRRMLSARPDHE